MERHENHVVLLPRIYPGSRDTNPAVVCSSKFLTPNVRLSWLKQGELERFGDHDVRHIKVESECKIDYNSLPELEFRHYQYDGSWSYNYSYNEHYIYHSTLNSAFGFSCLTYKRDTPEVGGEIAPAGSVNVVSVYAFKVYVKDGIILFNKATSWDPSIHGIPKQNPRNGWEIYPQQLDADDEQWTWAGPQVIYDPADLTWYFDNISVGEVIHQPPIPYQWIDWALNNKPKQPVTDYEALSECFRNTVTKYTTMSSNNLANALEFLELGRDIYNGNISALFQSFSDMYKGKRVRVKLRNPETGNTRWITSTVPGLIKDYGIHFVRKVLPDVWLKYRYMYNTTKSDADGTIDYILHQRYQNLYDHNNVVMRGSIGISLGTLRLKMRLVQKKTLAENIKHMFSGPGFFPDLHTLWDMVPFSFIVDWFDPMISDTMEDLDQAYLSELYRVDELLVTTDEYWDINYAGFIYHVHDYRRYFMDECPQFEIYEGIDNAKSKTVVKRIVDGISLISSIGGK